MKAGCDWYECWACNEDLISPPIGQTQVCPWCGYFMHIVIKFKFRFWEDSLENSSVLLRQRLIRAFAKRQDIP